MMEAAALTLSSTFQIDPLRLFTSTGHKPTITINPRNKTMTFHQPTLFPDHGHLQVMCGHKSYHVAHVVRSGKMNGDDGNMARGAVGPTVVLPMCRSSLACPCGGPSSTNPPGAEESAPATPGSTLEALMNMAETVSPQEAQGRLDNATRINRIDLVLLQEAARELSFRGDKVKTDAAIGKLTMTYKYLKDIKLGQDAYNYGLVLVEMLIYQGNLLEAKKQVEELDILADVDNDSPLAADCRLYKAIIHLMLRDAEEQIAHQAWKEYAEKISFGPPAVQDAGIPAVASGAKINFEKFKEEIEKLRKKIEGRW